MVLCVLLPNSTSSFLYLWDWSHSQCRTLYFIFLKSKQSYFEFDIDCDHSSNPFRFWVMGKMCMNIYFLFSSLTMMLKRLGLEWSFSGNNLYPEWPRFTHKIWVPTVSWKHIPKNCQYPSFHHIIHWVIRDIFIFFLKYDNSTSLWYNFLACCQKSSLQILNFPLAYHFKRELFSNNLTRWFCSYVTSRVHFT